jgi:DNA-binding transcriptional LysR family regulator
VQIPLDADRLLAFVTVARERGFSRAARALGKTQSAVSQAVLHLERELGHALLVRDGRSSHVTEAGATLLEDAERILADMANARDRLSALGGVTTGRLRIGASDTLACHVLPSVLAAFRARHPGVDLHLDNRPSPATAVEVAERRTDVGVVALPLPAALEVRGRPIRERVIVEPLAPYADVVILPPKHALARRTRIRGRDLAEEPLLLLDRTTGTRAFLDALFQKDGVRPHVLMDMSSVEVLKRLVALGFGVSVVPSLAVERELAEGALAAVPLAASRKDRRIGLVTPATGAPSRAAAAFLDVARAEISRRG